MKAEGGRRKAKGGRRKAEEEEQSNSGSPFLPPPSSFLLRKFLPPSSFLLAFLLGALTVLGFAPVSLYALPVLTFAFLLWLWRRQPVPRRAAACGFAFGLGFFLSGASWVYVSLHDFGAMPAPIAAFTTLLFCAYLALFPALAGYLYARARAGEIVKLTVVVPAVWTLLEWTRGWLFTGFSWLAFGYSQVPSSPVAGYAPVLGVYGVTLATVVSSGLIVVLWARIAEKAEGARRKAEGNSKQSSLSFSFLLPPSSFLLSPFSFLLLAIWLGGFLLNQVEWTRPAGDPVAVSLLQGNVPQDLKWQPERVRATLDDYGKLAQSSSSRLIIFPETALPLFLDNVPREYLDQLAAHARKNGGDMLIGVPERLPGGEYYNSVLSFGAAPTQSYRKHHLVPFGEFIPLRPVLGWIVSVLAIPLQDFSRGPRNPVPLEVAGQRVAVNVCYEDAFGEEIIRQLPHATMLVNVSNVAWFGRSIAPRQHLQISQTRALETGRYMLRATNTGVTAVINPRGRVEKIAPEFTRAVVSQNVRGYQGATPYVRWGNYAVLLLAAAMIASALVMGRRRPVS
jgi:apolipoprotein N-acyltransferase